MFRSHTTGIGSKNFHNTVLRISAQRRKSWPIDCIHLTGKALSSICEKLVRRHLLCYYATAGGGQVWFVGWTNKLYSEYWFVLMGRNKVKKLQSDHRLVHSGMFLWYRFLVSSYTHVVAQDRTTSNIEHGIKTFLHLRDLQGNDDSRSKTGDGVPRW